MSNGMRNADKVRESEQRGYQPTRSTPNFKPPFKPSSQGNGQGQDSGQSGNSNGSKS